jgi:hypothetical protein
MKPKLRSVNTRFWDDSWVQGLTTSERLIFLYLLTNPLTNILGIYEISYRRIVFDTGIKEEIIKKALKRFEKDKKAFFFDDFGYVVLPNFLKNNSLNTNMKVGAVKEYNNLPNNLKDRLFGNGLEGFESLLNGLVKYERESERESEREESSSSDEISKETPTTKYSKFYDKELMSADDPGYTLFVQFLFGENDTGEPLKNVLNLPKQFSYKKWLNLKEDYFDRGVKVTPIILAMENYNKLQNNTDAYLTCRNWIERDLKAA